MAGLNKEPNQKPRSPGVNIAGDFSADGTTIAPDAMTENDYVGAATSREARETIAPDERAPLSPQDAQHMREQRERTKQESLKASAQTQSTLGGQASGGLVNPSSNSNANTDWPVDQ